MLDRTPPHAFFAVSAVFHYLGPAFAVLLKVLYLGRQRRCGPRQPHDRHRRRHHIDGEPDDQDTGVARPLKAGSSWPTIWRAWKGTITS